MRMTLFADGPVGAEAPNPHLRSRTTSARSEKECFNRNPGRYEIDNSALLRPPLLRLVHLLLSLAVEPLRRQCLSQRRMITGIQGRQFHRAPKFGEGIIHLALVEQGFSQAAVRQWIVW